MSTGTNNDKKRTFLVFDGEEHELFPSQKFYQAEADALFPVGCRCGNNGGGDCDWCGVYYYGPEHDGYEETEVKTALALPEREKSHD